MCSGSSVWLSFVSSGLATGWSLVQGVLPTVYKCKITDLIRGGLGPTRAAAPLNNNNNNETLEIFHTEKKGQLLNPLERYNIYDLSKHKKQMNDIFANQHNPIIELIIKNTPTTTTQ
jgi:hypothetical protein